MTDLDKALAALREARDENASIGHEPVSWFLVDAALAALDAARGEAVVHLGRYFCDGPEGHFWCDSLTHARKFVDAVDADHEWTITTVAPPAADAALADTQRAIIEAAERRGYELALADLRAYGPEAMLAAAERKGECPHAARCDCLGGCKRGMRGNGAVAVSDAALDAAPCVCGEPTLGVVHRADGPCYLPEQAPPAAPVVMLPYGWHIVPRHLPDEVLVDTGDIGGYDGQRGDAEHRVWWESAIDSLAARVPCPVLTYTQAQPAAAVPADNVTPMRQPRADLARLVESIKAAVYANGDGLSVTEAIGALELAKLELLKEQEQ